MGNTRNQYEIGGHKRETGKRTKPLYNVFTEIPARYDFINHLITWGMDECWRNRAAIACLTNNPENMLDLCCGTGSLALRMAKLSGGKSNITGLDFSQPMLDLARQKASHKDRNSSVKFVLGDAASLPFPDRYFDAIGIAFAFRNLIYKNPLATQHLAEIFRVLKPSGHCVIVESSQPANKYIRKLYHFYMRHFVSVAGAVISSNKGAYRYLGESASQFYSPVEMRNLMLNQGFAKISYQPFFFGVAGLYVAVK